MKTAAVLISMGQARECLEFGCGEDWERDAPKTACSGTLQLLGGEGEACVVGQGVLAMVEAQKSSGTDFNGAGDVEDVQGAAAKTRRFHAEFQKIFHQ